VCILLTKERATPGSQISHCNTTHCTHSHQPCRCGQENQHYSADAPAICQGVGQCLKLGIACHSSSCEKHKKEDDDPRWPGQKARPYIPNNQSKRVGGMAQAIEYQPTKRKGLSLNSSTVGCVGGGNGLGLMNNLT
jgi:hypothetical protein